ncbi:PIN domain-containing protein [Geomesophilobacter sediminis]|uniref:PIN domain-containing protein n=1 Tax=Geomesophilobacter sediminis TaxID=2798584 RepID=A0A8J7LYF3_9BACT|nr:hypothetical protein [Geomesophilobacter sediminis]MBJ6724702.1 hypothetical protein [Geomesophilobacter sediminis]
MVAIDTNVAVRLLVNDDPAQTSRAVELFQANDIFIAKSVVLEAEWVLRGVYRLAPKQVNESLRKLLSLQQVWLRMRRPSLRPSTPTQKAWISPMRCTNSPAGVRTRLQVEASF